jgi:hypothetical protein
VPQKTTHKRKFEKGNKNKEGDRKGKKKIPDQNFIVILVIKLPLTHNFQACAKKFQVCH